MIMEERIPTAPPRITRLSDEEHRPLLSVMIPAYNAIHYLPTTLESVLAQYTGADQMQIEVVDDCSTDGDVKSLVDQIGQGKVSYFRQPKNKGSLRNFETCINRARGHYIHILHGDDFVKPGFYQEIISLFAQFPTIGSAITNHNQV